MQAEEKETRVLLARKDHGKDEMLGEITPIFELEGNILSPLTEHNFCPTMRVFIKSNYEDLDKRFEDDEIFKISVTVSNREAAPTDTGRLHCKYVASGRDAERVKAKDYIQIVQHPLPDASNRILQLNDHFPGTQYIFVEDAGYMYGPFKWQVTQNEETITEIKIEFIDTQLPNVRLIPYQVYKIDLRNADVEHAITVSDRANVKMINDLSIIGTQDAVSYEDYASDDEIMRFCGKVAADFNAKMIDKKQIDVVVATLNKNPKIKGDVYRTRLARFAEIGGEVHEIKQEVIEALSGFFNTEHGRKVVSQYIEENEEAYLAKIRKAKEKDIDEQLALRKAEINEVNERIHELNETKSRLNIEVEKKREAANSEEQLQSAHHETDKQIQEKHKEIERLKAYIEEMKPLVKGFKKIEDLIFEGEVLERTNQKLTDTRDQLRQETRSLKSECDSAEDELRSKLVKLRPYVDYLNGPFFESDAPDQKIYVPTTSAPVADSLVERQKAIIDLTDKELRNNGRFLDDWQIANLLISTQQSFITFMAGLPGVGKTSLARLLFEVQGLKARSREISVARGWTGQKDIIGYYNPLASRFQPANTGLYHFLKELDTEEKRDSDDKAMSYVLLDEANLSPIEHYWSAFMGMTDSEENRTLILGEDEFLIPNSLRFISTINYDGTTEPLSPRVVDRAPVIVLEPRDVEVSFDAPPQEITTGAGFPLSATDMDVLFGRDEKAPELEDDEKLVYTKVKSILMDPAHTMGRPISISPRKEIAIRQFCGKARAVMREHQDLRALDIAILQHVLPLIRGNGPNFAKRIEKLRAELERADMSFSLNYVTRMLSVGEEDLHSYDFFCW